MKKRVLVMTGSDSNMHNVLDLTVPSKIRYTQKHGYDFLTLRSFKPIPELGIDNDIIGLGFARTIFAFQMLEYYDVVMWLDGDSIITNDKMPIEDFITKDHTIYFSYDWPVAVDGSTGHVGFSGGNFILQLTDQTNTLLNTFVQASQQYTKDTGSDQACFNAIYNQTPLRKDFKILDHKYLNAVPEFISRTSTWQADPNRTGPNKRFTIPSPWNEDCFIAHLTGCSSDDRIDLLQNELKSYL
jgi:hypothetical protein